jgi:hypothetical protein
VAGVVEDENADRTGVIHRANTPDPPHIDLLRIINTVILRAMHGFADILRRFHSSFKHKPEAARRLLRLYRREDAIPC